MIKSCYRLNSSSLIAATGGSGEGSLYPVDPMAVEFDGYVITTYINSLGEIAGSGPVGSTPYQAFFCDRIMQGDRAIYRVIYYGELMATSSEFQLTSGKMGQTIYLSTCFRAAAGPRSIMLNRPLYDCPTTINAVLTPIETLRADKHFILRPAFDVSLDDPLKTASWSINVNAGEDSAAVGCEVSYTQEGKAPISAYATASPKGSVLFDYKGMYRDLRFLDVQLKTNLTGSGTALAKQFIDMDSPVAVGVNNTLYWMGWELQNDGSYLGPSVVTVDNPLGSDRYDNIRLLTLGAVRT